jgi:hypothetical protein
MKTIKLNSEFAALDYLRRLPASAKIEIPGACHSDPFTPAVEAIYVIVGESANTWASSKNRWDWTAGELLEALELSNTEEIKETEEGLPPLFSEDFR